MVKQIDMEWNLTEAHAFRALRVALCCKLETQVEPAERSKISHYFSVQEWLWSMSELQTGKRKFDPKIHPGCYSRRYTKTIAHNT